MTPWSIANGPTDDLQTLEHVEYTVRAATSVLGDLVHKCPPAEACRDAFDRMAKATIKMCQTTTGFGSQVRFSSDPPSSSPFIPQGFEKEIPTAVFSAGSILATGGSRPPPQFDYNLKDLFPEASLPMRRFGQNEDSANAGWIQQTGQAPAPQQYHHPSPATTNTSVTSSNPTSNPSSVTSNPQPTFRQPSYGTTTQQQQQQQQAQHYDPHLLTSTPAIMPTTYDNSGSYTFDFSNSTDFDFLVNHHDSMPPTYTGAAASGLNLGFDGRADWTGNGEMPDLFGGFFFGGGSGGMDQMDGMDFGDGGDGGGDGHGGHGGGEM